MSFITVLSCGRLAAAAAIGIGHLRAHGDLSDCASDNCQGQGGKEEELFHDCTPLLTSPLLSQVLALVL